MLYGADSYGQLEMMPAYRVKKNPNGLNCSSINPSEKHFVGKENLTLGIGKRRRIVYDVGQG